MKLVQLEIRDFRSIEHLKLDFRDELGRPRNSVLLVGPNASGKTTILDAIAACLGPALELPATRPDFRLEPGRVVRRGAVRTQVTCTLQFSEDEIAAAREVIRLADQRSVVPPERVVTVAWEYPYGDASDELVRLDPPSAPALLRARVLAARNLHVPGIGFSWLRRLGGVFTFDQQRTGLGKVIPRDLWDVVAGRGNGQDEGARYTRDPRTLLLGLAVKAAVVNVTAEDQDTFRALKDRYARVCYPHTIVGPIQDEVGNLDILFSDGTHEFRYDGLSSGEQMVLLFLMRFASEHIHRSIVLVDEVELHQHPLWQRKLVNALAEMGEDNQLIMTTHSAYLRDLAPRASIVRLGELGGPPRRGGEG